MEKVLFGGVLIAAATAAGALIREGMRQRMSAIEELNSDLMNMRALLTADRKALRELLGFLAERGKHAALWKEMLERIEKGEELHTVSGSICKRFALPNDAAGELEAYFSRFGSGDVRLEAEKLNALISSLNEAEKRMRADCEKKMKLALPLCAMAGCALALIAL